MLTETKTETETETHLAVYDIKQEVRISGSAQHLADMKRVLEPLELLHYSGRWLSGDSPMM